jgi:SAM-dependent methyltransferase
MVSFYRFSPEFLNPLSCDNLSPMDITAQLDQIPRGNTCPGVNRAIIEYLLALKKDFAGEAVLDVPCGSGEFLRVMKTFFPACETFGADIAPPENDADHGFLQTDLTGSLSLGFGTKFKLITSISGVMEFDNTLNFLRNVCQQIDEQGLLVVTNDNLLSVRDRFLYLFAGRLRQYPLFLDRHAPTWKILPLQNFLRILEDAGFEAGDIRYVPAKWSEWLWLPIAAPIYLFQLFSFLFPKNEFSYNEKTARYPFASLFSRHYFIVCRPIQATAH